jgi:hypothetical protein
MERSSPAQRRVRYHRPQRPGSLVCYSFAGHQLKIVNQALPPTRLTAPSFEGDRAPLRQRIGPSIRGEKMGAQRPDALFAAKLAAG